MVTAPKKLQSDFGLLDVKHGRQKLSDYFDHGGKPIKVLIEAEISNQWGNDDGTSIEFTLHVRKVTVQE